MSEYKKLTMKDFERYFINKEEEGEVCIHCSTKEEFNKICEIMDMYNIKTMNGEKYIYKNRWYHMYEENTVIFNNGTYCDVEFAEKNHYTIFDFVDITKKENNLINNTDQEEKVLEMLANVWNEYLKLDVQHPNEREYFANGINQCQSMIAMRIARNSRPDLFPIKK